MHSDNATSVPRLTMKGISKKFGPTVALGNVDFQVQAGEVHALIGENGAGKSTLMKILSGAYSPDSGKMYIDGERYSPSSPIDGRNCGVAMIYQELSLAQDMTVMDNIVLGSEPCFGPFVSWKAIKKRAQEALSFVGLENLPLKTVISTLSNAKQQLIEVARNVAIGSKIIVFDEPTSSLSQKDSQILFKLIRQLKSKNYAIVYISHFLEEIREISDSFTVLRDGVSVGSGMSESTETRQIIQMMVGRNVEELYPRSDRTPGEEVLNISKLSGESLPQDLSLSLHRGEIIGIAGVVGAGRTEFLRCLFGLDPIRTGEVTISGIKGSLSSQRMWKSGAGIVSEDRKLEGLALELSIAENLTLPKQPFLVTSAWQREATLPWIEKIPIKCASPFQEIDNLSGGNQQKVAIARLLHSGVDILLLDEPTRGIDIGSKAQIYQLIDELACGNPDKGIRPKAILLISSYLPELLGCCDKIGVMCKGRLGPLKNIKEVDEHSIMLEATGTESY
jgi:ribose transport system ATP-binding protein